MSKDEAIKLALSRRSFLYKRKMLKNIDNGLGVSMIEKVIKDAGHIFVWSQYFSKKWGDVKSDE